MTFLSLICAVTHQLLRGQGWALGLVCHAYMMGQSKRFAGRVQTQGSLCYGASRSDGHVDKRHSHLAELPLQGPVRNSVVTKPIIPGDGAWLSHLTVGHLFLIPQAKQAI